jgi:hypothetical protein
LLPFAVATTHPNAVGLLLSAAAFLLLAVVWRQPDGD